MRTAVVLVAAAVSCSQGTTTPPVAVSAVPTAANTACTRFHDALPKDLGPDLERRRTTPDDPHVAAYGDPPVVVRCGAPQGGKYKPGDQTFVVDGVRWFPDERPDGTVVWSLPTSFVNVEVTIPPAWTGDRLARLTAAVEAAQRS